MREVTQIMRFVIEYIGKLPIIFKYGWINRYFTKNWCRLDLPMACQSKSTYIGVTPSHDYCGYSRSRFAMSIVRISAKNSVAGQLCVSVAKDGRGLGPLHDRSVNTLQRSKRVALFQLRSEKCRWLWRWGRVPALHTDTCMPLGQRRTGTRKDAGWCLMRRNLLSTDSHGDKCSCKKSVEELN